MRCPHCDTTLSTIDYEGVAIETCNSCGGEWLDDKELGHIVRIREEIFSAEERRAIEGATKIPGIPMADVEREIVCPTCSATTVPINYGGNTGVIIDRCPECRGIWLDGGELEKIQMLIESWKDDMPEALKKYGPRLHQVATELESRNKVAVSRLPLIGGLVNAMVNGILDLKP
jgi:Zn-finger nucleic acid-binding protein